MKKKTIVLNPRNDKKLLIIAGTHGNETLAVRLLAQLQDDLSKNKILFNDVGVITIANMFNESGLRNNSREWVDETQDSDDLNRSFTNGTPTGMDDAIIEMKSMIDSHDMVIDIHNSPTCVDMILLDANCYAESIASLYRQNGFNNCFYWASTSNTIKSYANRKCPTKAITVEIGGMGQVTSSEFERHLNNLYNIIKLFTAIYAMTLNDEGFLSSSIPDFTKFIVMESHAEGILVYRDYDNYDRIYLAGECIDEIIDSESNVKERFIAQTDCRMIAFITDAYVPKNACVGQMWAV